MKYPSMHLVLCLAKIMTPFDYLEQNGKITLNSEVFMSNGKKEIKWFEPLPEEEQEGTVTDEKVSKSSIGLQEKGESAIHFEKFTREFEQWLWSIAGDMDMDDRPDIAFQALRSVLHAIRDRVIPSEVFDLSAQLPLMIRGVFFEGYNLKDKPDKYNADEFLEIIEQGFYGNTSVDAEVALSAVLKVLYEKVSEGEMEDIYGGMPKDIKKLWKQSLKK